MSLALLASHCRATSDPTNFHEPDHFSDDKIPIDLFHIPLGIPDPVIYLSYDFKIKSKRIDCARDLIQSVPCEQVVLDSISSFY